LLGPMELPIIGGRRVSNTSGVGRAEEQIIADEGQTDGRQQPKAADQEHVDDSG
jgi:hypothetical protein